MSPDVRASQDISLRPMSVRLLFIPPTLWNVTLRHMLRHRLQTVLMILGIVLGVAVAVSIDLANVSASRAFDLSIDSMAGRATHQIVGGPGGIDESIFVALRRAGAVDAAAPVLVEYVLSPQLGNVPLQLLGIDPFSEAPFRSYLATDQGVPVTDLTAFLTRPGAILISTELASRYSLAPGDGITLSIAGQEKQAWIAGFIQPADDLSRRALDGLILTDISTAQELTGRLGRLDRIDLILDEEDDPTIAGIRNLLPAGARLIPVEARRGSIEEMTSAFRVNLAALSLLALLVGMFLIYNTMTFSVIQRRSLFGTLRCLGVIRAEVFGIVLGEALVVGVLGAGLGTAVGVALGQFAIQAVTQTINDLYFTVTVRSVQIPVDSLARGAALGIVATVLSAIPPAWEAAFAPPRAALRRSRVEDRSRRIVVISALAGLALVSMGVALLALPTGGLGVSFAGTFAIIVGFAMLTPVAMKVLMQAATLLLGRIAGSPGRMAPRNVLGSLSRTAIAVAALMVSIAVTIGISLMVGSFRHTVIIWLAQTLQSDIYIASPEGSVAQPSTPIDPAVIDLVEHWPGIARVDTLRTVTADTPHGQVSIAATTNSSVGYERYFLSLDVPAERVWSMLQEGAVLVSEPLANQAGIASRGGVVTLYTDQGTHDFPVIGIYFDYSSSQGIVLMSQEVYRRYWRDDAITAVGIRLEPGVDGDEVVHELRVALAPVQRLSTRANQALREEVLVVFDRTFAITGALQILATGVAFVGILSAFLSLELEKKRELGILRAIGLTDVQLWRLVLTETALMGATAGVLAMPTGLALALILIYVINRRSFGWTLQLQLEPVPFLVALGIGIGAAILAGVYPAHRMTRLNTSEAIRFE